VSLTTVPRIHAFLDLFMRNHYPHHIFGLRCLATGDWELSFGRIKADGLHPEFDANKLLVRAAMAWQAHDTFYRELGQRIDAHLQGEPWQLWSAYV
jgi:hypothetical protein